MSDKLKNIISNILGLLMSIASVFALVYDKIDVTKFILLMIVGLGLFLFKSERVKNILGKIISKKTNEGA
jgi:hypothetical protein